jgi:polysaccharide export outer membrane protein
MNRILFLLLLTLIVASCVPAQKEILLQGNQEAENAPINTPVSNFKAKDYTYRLRPDDIISIKVSSTTPSEFDFFNQQADRSISGFDPTDPLLTGFKVEEDGTIPLPVVGKVEVEGLTVEEARARVQEIVEQYLDSPTVDVKLLSFQFTILGEVKSEGRYTTYNPKLNILEALGVAGGLTDYANRSRVKIVRKDKNDIEIAYVNVLEDDLLTSPYYYLQPNDIITVAPLGAKNWRTNNLANIGILFSGISSVALLLNFVLK